MNNEDRQRALEKMRENIAAFGYHFYVVGSDQSPRYAYTIGLTLTLGYELVFAGGIFFMYEEVKKIIEGIVEQLRATPDAMKAVFAVEPFGNFTLRSCDPSWVTLLMLGATDYFQRDDIPTLQIIPDYEHNTIDVPDMAVPWNPKSHAVWRWLTEPWPYAIPSTSNAVADLDALRGFAVTEACRWEADYWELFAGAGPDIPKGQTRVVGLGVLLAADPSLAPILDLNVGDGIWREDGSEWQVWKKTERKTESPA